jgi:hypothetical protein
MAVIFNGSTANYLGRTTGVLNHNAPYTWAVWFRVDALTDANIMMFGRTDDTAHEGISVDTSGNLAIYINGGASVAAGTVSTGVWYHGAMVRESNTSLKFYLDGVLQGTQTFDITGRAAAQTMALGTYLGSGSYDALTGRVESCKLWTTALTATQISDEAKFYNPANGASVWAWHPLTVHTDVTDKSGNARNWTANGTLTTGSTPGTIGWARRRDALLLDTNVLSRKTCDSFISQQRRQAAAPTRPQIRFFSAEGFEKTKRGVDSFVTQQRRQAVATNKPQLKFVNADAPRIPPAIAHQYVSGIRAPAQPERYLVRFVSADENARKQPASDSVVVGAKKAFAQQTRVPARVTSDNYFVDARSVIDSFIAATPKQTSAPQIKSSVSPVVVNAALAVVPPSAYIASAARFNLLQRRQTQVTVNEQEKTKAAQDALVSVVFGVPAVVLRALANIVTADAARAIKSEAQQDFISDIQSFVLHAPLNVVLNTYSSETNKRVTLRADSFVNEQFRVQQINRPAFVVVTSFATDAMTESVDAFIAVPIFSSEEPPPEPTLPVVYPKLRGIGQRAFSRVGQRGGPKIGGRSR